MKILIELPTWLGDAVMATPAIENVMNFYKEPKVTLIGSAISIEVLKDHPYVIKTHILDKEYFNLFKTLKVLGDFDIFLSFRSSFRSKLISFFISSKKKYQFNKKKFDKGHQVEKYNSFINESLSIDSDPTDLMLHTKTKNESGNQIKLLGINPGASYGSAKQWNPRKFAGVAHALSNQYDIVIFGGPDEKDIANEIENNLIAKGVDNYSNLASQTSISQLISKISSLDLFITGDSGPMHLAAAFQIPTVSIFGPTIDTETSQWMNKKSIIVKKHLDCQPCMERVCPLKHHNCMKQIEVIDVLNAVEKLN
jgi:heptosyltransferase II